MELRTPTSSKIGVLCTTSHEAPLSVHNKPLPNRTGATRTSENSAYANFAEFLFHALR
jgi:hypothetical protein